jgi:hypothetical protein
MIPLCNYNQYMIDILSMMQTESESAVPDLAHGHLIGCLLLLPLGLHKDCHICYWEGGQHSNSQHQIAAAVAIVR